MNGFKPPRFFRCPDLNCQYLDRGGQSPRTPGRTLLQITHVVDADDVLRRIPYRLVSGDVGFAENVRLTVKGFALADGLDGFAFRVQDGSDRSRAIVLFYVGGDTDILVAVFHENCCRALSLLNYIIDQIEIVVDL